MVLILFMTTNLSYFHTKNHPRHTILLGIHLQSLRQITIQLIRLDSIEHMRSDISSICCLIGWLYAFEMENGCSLELCIQDISPIVYFISRPQSPDPVLEKNFVSCISCQYLVLVQSHAQSFSLFIVKCRFLSGICNFVKKKCRWSRDQGFRHENVGKQRNKEDN